MSLAALALLGAACRGTEQAGADVGGGAAATPIFLERSAESGLDFVHWNGMSGELYMVEMVGAGAALLDYDGDGDLDVYLVQGGMLGPGKTPDQALVPPPAGPLSDRLYRNDLGADGSLHFVDVTVAAALLPGDYGQGAATGDIDNDGFVDLYITHYGANRLLHNDGDGTFTDVTEQSGTGDARWGTSAAFADFDRDGFLDLFVCNYLDATMANHFQCSAESGLVDYCGPLSFDPLPAVLYRNRGDGTFEDVSAAAGIAAKAGSALGVVAIDVDRDGLVDFYVANDQMANFLWRNRGDGTFVEDAVLAGCAVNREGRAEASMGVDSADWDGDGDRDLFLTHLTNETNTLYLSDGRGIFTDATPGSGLGPPSLPFTSFGTLALDYDNDSWLDLLVVSGTVRRIAAQLQAGEILPLRQATQLFRNLGGGRFEVVAGVAALERLRVSRGAAFGDIDNDGDTDAVVANNNDQVELLINQVGQERPWLGLHLEAPGLADPLGSEVTVLLGDGRRLVRWVHTDGSYLSAGDVRILVGLGTAAPSLQAVEVIWPEGRRTTWRGVAVGRYATLRSSAPSGAGRR